MRDDLQELVDRVSRLLGAPATLEDADFTLLAFCAHPMGGEGGAEGVLEADQAAQAVVPLQIAIITDRGFQQIGQSGPG